MPTTTRTSTGTATKVALGIAIGASAAFAAVSLNSSMMKQSLPGGYSSGPKKMPPGYQVQSADYCINKCLIAHSQCVSAGRGNAVCTDALDRCVSVCQAPAPGYVPGYVPPAPPVQGYVPAGYVPGYVPPAAQVYGNADAKKQAPQAEMPPEPTYAPKDSVPAKPKY